MPTYSVHFHNEDFVATSSETHPDDECAMRAALRGLLVIGIDEVSAGKSFFGAELRVSRDGEIISQRMVAVGSSPLL